MKRLKVLLEMLQDTRLQLSECSCVDSLFVLHDVKYLTKKQLECGAPVKRRLKPGERRQLVPKDKLPESVVSLR